jgi:hypothetical protein
MVGTSTALFTTFRTNCCPCVLIRYGKGYVHADEETKVIEKESDVTRSIIYTV